MKRRQFLHWTGASLVAHQSMGQRISPASSVETAQMIVTVWLPNGEPVTAERLQRLYFLDLGAEPLSNPSRQVEAGRLVFQWPGPAVVAIALQLPVIGFGDVTLYADNQGQGFGPSDFPLNLNRAFAWDRLARVMASLERWRQAGYGFAASIGDRLSRAQVALEQADQTIDLSAQLALWNQALVDGLWAGEDLVLARARQRIVQHPPRQGFKFGCNAFGYPHLGAEYDQALRQLFNFATVPFYWKDFEPEPGHPQFDRVDRQVDWLRRQGITPKGHPLVWFHEVGIPDWIRGWPYEAVKAALVQRVEAIVRHYGDRIPYYDVINEAHDVPWSNDLGYTPEQLLDLTRVASSTVRAVNPAIQRIVNNCCLWARNVALYGPPQRSPYRYIQACLAAGIDFELIGLQLYYPNQDMFEIDRMLDRFIGLGKPIHITEMATSSSSDLDSQTTLKPAPGLWHAPWSQAVQADWVEQIYTLAYSKPEIEAISWWDLSDRSSFWPSGGLLDSQNRPKAAYYRLQGLVREWGGGPEAEVQ